MRIGGRTELKRCSEVRGGLRVGTLGSCSPLTPRESSFVWMFKLREFYVRL